MQFDSITYGIFLAIVFLLYWAIPSRRTRLQNTLLVASGFTFYAWWDWRFAALLALSVMSAYVCTLPCRIQRYATAAGIAINIGTLALFKYYNFFVDQLSQILSTIGFKPSLTTLNIVLPIGISFYTFQAISYIINCRRKRIEPCRNIIDFTAFMTFFPQLVAGPIERAEALLPQMQQPRTFRYDDAVTGMRQILWGVVKKVTVADVLAGYTDTLFYNPASISGATAALACVIFLIQLYADFSAYCDIAIGSARLFGIRLSANFRYPLFSTSVGEYWRRWHITLMTWLRDYVYIPLGGSRCSTARTIVNLMIVFLISGIWHGASINIIVWGVTIGIFISIERIVRNSRITLPQGKVSAILGWAYMFTVAVLVHCAFRSPNMPHAIEMLSRIFSADIVAIPMGVKALATIVPFMAVEWIGYRKGMEFPLQRLPKSTPVRWAIYWGLTALIVWQAGNTQIPFIYFQF